MTFHTGKSVTSIASDAPFRDTSKTLYPKSAYILYQVGSKIVFLRTSNAL